jgi:hypothetical protein
VLVESMSLARFAPRPILAEAAYLGNATGLSLSVCR